MNILGEIIPKLAVNTPTTLNKCAVTTKLVNIESGSRMANNPSLFEIATVFDGRLQSEVVHFCETFAISRVGTGSGIIGADCSLVTT